MRRKSHPANQEGLNSSRTSRWSCGPVWSPNRKVQCQPKWLRREQQKPLQQQQSSSWDLYKLLLSKAVKTFYFTEDQENSASTSRSDHAYRMPKRKTMCPDGHIWLAASSDEGEKDMQGWNPVLNIMAGSFQLPPWSEGKERLRQGGIGQEIISL